VGCGSKPEAFTTTLHSVKSLYQEISRAGQTGQHWYAGKQVTVKSSPLFTILLLKAFAISFAAVPARVVPLALDTPLNGHHRGDHPEGTAAPQNGVRRSNLRGAGSAGQWPKVSAKEEQQIEQTLTQATGAGHPRLRNIAAWGLGARGRMKSLTSLSIAWKQEPDLFRCFFYSRNSTAS
jgi:hypothetical protein